MRRALVLCLGLALAGACGGAAHEPSAGADEPNEEGDDGVGGGGEGPGSPDGIAACVEDTDCIAAASTCCACPSFAVPGGDDPGAGCDEVECEAEPADCPALEPACDDGVCTLRCAPVVTNQSCEAGFVRDEAGCLLDECAPPSSSAVECMVDADCVQVPADCCGCARGGEETAVPADEVEDHLDSLGCTGGDACPEVYVCDPDAAPMCVSGLCTLGVPAAEPNPEGAVELCGTPGLSPCPEGQVCVLNDADSPEAAELGVGTCRQP